MTQQPTATFPAGRLPHRGLLNSAGLLARTHGCLAGVAVGDALGFPAHDLDPQQVAARFGLVDRLLPAADDDPIHKGYAAGRVTDDTILTLVTAEAVLSTDTEPTTQDMARILFEWGRKNEQVWTPGNVFGPSTKSAFASLLASGGRFSLDLTRGRAHDGASNGAPMRMAPAGLVHPGDPGAAARLACALTLPTHPTQVAISAAAALAAGVATALQKGAEVLDIVEACLFGARIGEEWGREHARVVPAPSIERRLHLAVGLALAAPDAIEAARNLHAVIGGNLPAAEALPTAVGVLLAARGEPAEAMVAGASAGGDSDTIASMAGGLAGALRGIGAIPAAWLQQVEEVNSLELGLLASRLAARAGRAPG